MPPGRRPSWPAAPEVIPTDDPVLDALEALEAVVSANLSRNMLLLERIRQVRQERYGGHNYREIVTREARPGVVELATENLEALLGAAAHLRRVKARALHDEGVTMDDIAELFGVSRQRISALLRETRTTGGAGPR